MAPSIKGQTWAIMRRYFTSYLRTPFASIVRVIVWPGLLLVLTGRFLINNSDNKEALKSMHVEMHIPIISLLLTGFHLWSIVEFMVTDRSIGMRSLMISMGLKRRSWYFGYFFSFTLVVLPIIITLATFSIVFILTESKTSTFTICLVFLLFYVNITALAFASATIIPTPTAVFVVAFMLVLQNGINPLLIHTMGSISKDFYPFILFLAAISPYESMKIFTGSYTHCKHDCDIGASKEDNTVYQPIYLTLISLTLWSLILYGFARWFEEVCPWHSDSARKSFCFCFSRSIMNKYDDNLSDEDDSVHQDPTYFERVPENNREVGITIKKITKKFNNLKAVNDLSLKIYKGETTLLLGHNGAGKTTLMNIILGKLTPDKGDVKISKNSTKCIGVCPQSSVLDQNLTVLQHLYLFADIKSSNMTSSERTSQINKTIRDVSLENHVNKVPADLSGGMRRKLSLAMAFVGQSDVLILDEPSSGLDPDSRVFIWNAIRNYRKDRTVLLSTQHMEEADYLGDRIAIMSEGRIICSGSSIFLNNAFGNSYKIRIECRKNREPKIMSFVRKYFPSAKQLSSSSSTSSDAIGELTVELVFDKQSQDYEMRLIDMLEFIENNSNQSHHIKSFGLKSSSIEDVMHNTSKLAQSKREIPDSQQRLTMSSTVNRIDVLAKAPREPKATNYEVQKSILYALMVKQLQTYRQDWFSLLFFRVIIPIWVLKTMMSDLTGITSYAPVTDQAFLIFHLIYYPTVERSSKFKTMQLTSFASPFTYWLSHFLTDMVFVTQLTIAINILHYLTFDGLYVASSLLVHSILTIDMFLFGIAASIVAYILSTILKDSKACIGYHVLFYCMSLIVYIFTKILTIVIGKDMSWLNTITDNLFIIALPSDAMQYALTGLITRCYIRNEGLISFCDDDGEPSPLIDAQTKFSPVVIGLVILVGQIIIYCGLLIFIESMSLDLNWYLRYQNIKTCFMKRPTVSDMQPINEIDEDVVEESSRAARLIQGNSSKQGLAMITSKLEKSYICSKKVIDQLSFTVAKSECFGLLGVNGAGKSTTFSMLSAEIKPDAGRIWANGDYDHSVYRQELSYDPQSEPETSLSSDEALYLMARLRLLKEDSITEVVRATLDLLQMNQHAHKTSKQLSGGTRRKLALGMSLIGNPQLSLLDEPTAGVDPLARVDIWSLLKSLRQKNNASIVISSHAMEECEAVCDRIAIMARGRLRCIGTFLHLRSKFSQGCRVKIQISNTIDINVTTDIANKLNQRLQGVFGGAVQLADSNVNSATFNIANNTVKRSELLKILREFKSSYPNLYYMINDSSLEDIFIALAKEEQMLERQASGPI